MSEKVAIRQAKIPLTEKQKFEFYRKGKMPIECIPPALIEVYNLKVGDYAPFSGGCLIFSLEEEGKTLEEYLKEL